MKVIFNITENKNKATFQQEVVKINTSFNQTQNIVKPKFQTGYYPLPGGGGGDLSNYYTKNETDLLLENYYLKSETYSQNEVDDLLDDKQDVLNYTPENSANKSDSYIESSSITYASTKALVDGLTTKLDKGNYTGNAQDLKNEIDTKHKKLSSFDESILIETDGNIEVNISLFEEYFEQQECELNFNPIQIVAVYQDGMKLSNSEYEIILPKKIKIKEYVNENIQIEYTHLKS